MGMDELRCLHNIHIVSFALFIHRHVSMVHLTQKRTERVQTSYDFSHDLCSRKWTTIGIELQWGF